MIVHYELFYEVTYVVLIRGKKGVLKGPETLYKIKQLIKKRTTLCNNQLNDSKQIATKQPKRR